MSDGSNPENLERLRGAALGTLATEPRLTPERIREVIERLRGVPMLAVPPTEADQLARRFEESLVVSMDIGTTLVNSEHRPWLADANKDIDPFYWSRYRNHLTRQGWSQAVIVTMDAVTERTLDLLENPLKPGPWDRRGMVIGHVQSGKTANYTGLICKAADAGYRLIVVIAGIHNNLRNQTQIRIDQGFVGVDSARLLNSGRRSHVGVGMLDQRRRPVTFTNSQRDFNKRTATSVGVPLQNLTEPAVFVIKKNSRSLQYLIEWLKEHSTQGDGTTIDIPVLLIDDEADNASINIMQGRGAVSRINGQIRQLLNLFPRSAYVGYTATPFANIFIDPDTDDEMLGEDLFPRDFIMSLDPPSNYFGADKVFGDADDLPVRVVEDSEATLPLQHKLGHEVDAIPPSLSTAVRVFIVARAIRIARGQRTAHSSMLVNASRFTDVQRQIRNELHRVLKDMQASIRTHSSRPVAEALRNPEIAALHDAWKSEFTDTEFPWETIQAQLNEAVTPVSVVEINSRSASALNYADHEEHGLHVIAVGGYSLSRGLTLEGLMVSYFLRNSKMYDTLMQMARWFGYRPGYEDLCRVWMPEEAVGWYSHVADSIELLRAELRTMEQAGAAPTDFGLKVRAHPDTLTITARNKMGRSEQVVVEVGLANRFIETAILHRDPREREANKGAAQAFAKSLWANGFSPSDAERGLGGYLVRDVPVEHVVDFLQRYRNYPGSLLTETGPVLEYIAKRADLELGVWDVLFAGVRDASREQVPTDVSLGLSINCQRRQDGNHGDPRAILVTKKQRVASRGVEKIGLSPELVQAAEADFLQHRPATARERAKPSFPDYIYRNRRLRPLLVVHLLVIGNEGENLADAEPVVAWSISFPPTGLNEAKVKYTVNAIWLKEHFGIDSQDDGAEEEMAGDDGAS